MYVPEHFRMADESEALALMRGHPFAVLTSGGKEGLVATHLPTVVKAEGGGHVVELHFSRANPHWKALAAAPESEVLLVYIGPEAYIRPGWYPAKAAHGKVVPTWNYAVVHAYGVPEMINDGGWLARHVSELTNQQEGGEAAPWSTADAPPGFIAALTRGIVGARVRLTRIEGKVKMSQNREPADALGAAGGLEARGAPADAAVAAIVRSKVR